MADKPNTEALQQKVKELEKNTEKHKQAQKALKLNEERLESLLKLSKIRDLSEKQLVDYSLEEIVRLTHSKIGYLHFVGPDQRSIQLYSWSKEALKDCVAEKIPHYPLDEAGVWSDCIRLKEPVIHNDYQSLPTKKGYPEGHTHIIRHASAPVWDGNKIVAIVGVGNKAEPYDHTDVRQLSLFVNSLWEILNRKRAEEALRESESMRRGLFLAAPVGITVVKGRTFIDANNEFCNIVGYKKNELIGGTTRMLYENEEESARVGDELYTALWNQGFKSVETRHIRKDGEVRDIVLRAAPVLSDDASAGVVVAIEDITERKQALELIESLNRLKEKLLGPGSLKEKLRFITDGIVEIFKADFARIWMVKPGDLCDSECQHAKITEGPHICRYREGCLHLSASSGRYTHIDGGHRRVPFGCYKIGRVAAEDEPKFLTNDVINDPRIHDHEWAGKLGLVSFAGYRLLSATGRVIGVLALFSKQTISSEEDAQLESIAGTTAQIIQTTLAEEALQKSEKKYRLLVENLPSTVFIGNKDWSVEVFDDKIGLLTGYDADEFNSNRMKWIDIIIEEDIKNARESFIQALKADKSYVREYRIRSKTGDILWIQERGHIVCKENNDIDYVSGVFFDITETKKLEAQLQQSQKMEAMGTLAGGIAHDFNNLLMGIQGRTSLMSMDSDSSHPYFEHLKGIEDYVKSATTLTKQLLGFGRGGKYEVKAIDINSLVGKQNQMFGRTRKEINIKEKFEEDPWTVEVDQGQIEQVLLNIYVNAWQAMPGGGDLYIQTKNIIIDKEYSKPYQVRPGNYVKISITDTGVGMDEATRQRIFDPFFTTKEMGRGTGLGLASAYGIIKNHQGFINVYSEKDEGTTFNIYFPASGKAAVQEKEFRGELLRGTETLLLVDDEDMILDVGCGIIEKLGYTVLTAKSGETAIEIYKKNHDKIDMIILDIVMPGMGGGDTFDKLKKINPTIKVLLSSGYSINGQASEILDRGCNGFIQKPFYTADLSKKIREILDND
ncbi:GAF domain-containing protein [Thermodesulfobacteriota bacterium]